MYIYTYIYIHIYIYMHIHMYIYLTNDNHVFFLTLRWADLLWNSKPTCTSSWFLTRTVRCTGSICFDAHSLSCVCS